MESVEDDRLTIGAYIKRNDFRDVIISNKIKSIEDLKNKIVIGSSSRRRELQLKKINQNISVVNIKVLPAVGQGIIAVQCKKNDEVAKFFLKNINDSETELCAKAERKMLQVIGGDCETAIGGLATIENNNLKLKVQLFSDSGSDSFEHELIGKDTDAVNIGKAVGEKLLSLAGKEFKKK